MRRDEFNIKDDKSINEVLKSCEYGTLSLIYNNRPYCVALNFVFHDNHIYFHGANEGKKIEIIKNNNKASFLVVKPYSLIPSYFFNTLAACPATQFFASVYIEGEVSFIEEGDKKAEVLNILMQKLQKGKGYEKISYDKSMYKKMIDKVCIIRLNIDEISCKIKVGQNLNKEKKDKVLEKLNNRNLDIDKKTITKINEFND